jgi:hypothetical protein
LGVHWVKCRDGSNRQVFLLLLPIQALACKMPLKTLNNLYDGWQEMSGALDKQAKNSGITTQHKQTTKSGINKL